LTETKKRRRGLFPALLALSSVKLSDDVAHTTCANRASTLTDGKTQTFFHGDRGDQFDFNGDVIARHHHLNAFRKLAATSHV